MLPASTVPGSVGFAREGEAAFPREVPAEASRPRSVPQVPCARSLLIGLGFLRVPILALRPVFGSLAGSFFLRLAASNEGSLSDFDEAKLLRRPFAVPSARGLQVPPDPRRKVGSALACAAASRFFLPVARTVASIRFRSCELPPFSAWPSPGASLVSERPLPCDKSILAPICESRQAVNRESGLWITGIVGINMD